MRADCLSRFLQRISGLLVMFFVAPAPLLAAEPLLLTYIEKPPYYYTDALGEARGFLLERVRKALEGSKIAFRFESRPPTRVLHEIRLNQTASCSIGWFLTPEREHFARFSLPIYYDKPLVAVVTAARESEFPKAPKLSELFARPGIRVGAVAGYSYGEEVDRQLLGLGNRLDRAPSPVSNLAKLVAGRVDFALANSEELEDVLAQSPEMAKQLVRLGLSDAPPGKARYLMCSKQVTSAQMEHLDRAINQAGLLRVK